MKHTLSKLLIALNILGACSETPKTSQDSALGSQGGSGSDVAIQGQLSVEAVPSEVKGSQGVAIQGQEVEVKNSQGATVAKTTTSPDGSYTVIVQGALVVGAAASPAASLSLDGLSRSGLSLQAVVSKTANQDVLGIKEDLDFSKGRLLSLGKQELKKITAVRGNVTLETGGDHSGIVFYVPGTSYQVRTDAAGQFLMTFIPAGTYDMRVERDGFVPQEIKGVTVTTDETSKIQKIVMKLAGGASNFSVRQIGTEGVSRTTKVEWLISSGNADRFKGGLERDLEGMPYGPVPKTFIYDFKEDGVYTIKMTFANADGFEQTVQRNVVVDTTKPKSSGLALADRKTLNSLFTNERFVIAYHSDCKDIDTVAILPATATKASEADFIYPCLSTAAPSRVVYAIANGVSAFEYKIWARDLVGNISDTPLSGKLVFDAAPPQSPVVSLTDQTSGSSQGTDITTVNVSIASCADIEYVLISESQLLQPDPSRFSSKCNTTANGSIFTFANNIAGTKSVLIWAMDFAGNVSQVSSNASIVLDQTAPTASSFTLTDPTPANAGYSNDLDLIATPANCTDTTHLLISETQTTKPLETAAGWVACSTSGVSVRAASSGTRTFYLWARDIGGNISAASTNASIAVYATPLPDCIGFDPPSCKHLTPLIA